MCSYQTAFSFVCCSSLLLFYKVGKKKELVRLAQKIMDQKKSRRYSKKRTVDKQSQRILLHKHHCSACNIQFKNRSEYYRHNVKIHNKTKTSRWKCVECKKSFGSSYELKIHELRTREERTIKNIQEQEKERKKEKKKKETLP
ncbi:zinc finger protein [Reticulomyxa filosa]|uniref:Zinc finger protein n=1 Tax=Reticulomyxa filosa TaxID=46433 RepID=X6NWH0_RETFI|nr:zinc finger protein [Reticulomyxa filosa]|eukprot:ETO30228.1 zinc finger protein [Reticulomyxa filosa]